MKDPSLEGPLAGRPEKTRGTPERGPDKPAPASRYARDLASGDIEKLRLALVASEVLGPPVSLRRHEEE